MDTVARRLTRAVSGYDRELFVKREGETLRVLRKATRFLSYEVDGQHLLYSVSAPHVIFHLTDNWTVNGKPVEWGVEPLLSRLRAIDSHKRDVAGEIIENQKKSEEISKKDFRNNNEAFLKDFRRQFSKAFNNINTSTLDRKADLRRKREK